MDYTGLHSLLQCWHVRWCVVVILVIVTLPRIVKILWYLYCTTGCDSTGTDKPLPPGTLGFPFVGETVQLALKNASFYKEKEAKYGHVYKTHILGSTTVRVSGAENMRVILTGENTIVTSKWPRSVRLIFGQGSLAMSDGDIHKFRKRLILQAFSRTALESYLPTIVSNVRTYLKRWKDKGEIHTFPEVKRFAFDLALRVLVGTENDDHNLTDILTTFDTVTGSLFSLPFEIPGLGLSKGLKAKKRLLRHIYEAVDRIESEGSPQSFTSAIHHLLQHRKEENGEGYSREDLGDAVQELLFTGHDTITSAMNSAVMYLGKKPDVVQRIREELAKHKLLGDREEKTEDELSLKKITELTYVLNVTREVLRVAPSVGAGYRTALKTFEVGEYRIPKGWTVAFGIRDTHHSAPIFADPEEFNPDRWDELPNMDRQENDSKVDRFHYVPFGAGARTCVGKEYAKLVTRVFIIELCRSCSWTLHNENPKMKYIPVPRPSDDLPISISAYKTEKC